MSNYNNQNNGGSDFYTPTTRSAYRFFNSESSIDNTSMSFNFWNTLLKITINPIIVKEGSANKVDNDNHVDIFLSPAKAQMLRYCIREFRKNPDNYTNIGVSTNKGIIFIADGKKMFGHGGICIVINLIDNETGRKESEAAYEFNCKDMYAITDYMGGSDFSKDTSYSNSLELDMFENLLTQFINAYTNAVASSIMDVNKVNEARHFSFIKDVRDKLGISKSEGNRNYNRSNWFNNNSGNSYSSSSDTDSRNNNSSSYEDVMNDIASLMD
jgi:hypothetical protein